VTNSAEGAEYKSQGQARSASPLVKAPQSKAEALKGQNSYTALSGLGGFFNCYQGRRPDKSKLAPGFNMPRLWRCLDQVVAIITSCKGAK
jgi:hypothetical protein